MEATKFQEKCMSMGIRNKMGKDCGAGNMIAGSSHAGDENVFWANYEAGNFVAGLAHAGDYVEFNGIYQRRHNGDGIVTAKLKWYVTKNPRTVPQQANRGKFGEAVAGWQNLTSEQKAVYNLQSKGKSRSGYHIFIREHMKA